MDPNLLTPKKEPKELKVPDAPKKVKRIRTISPKIRTRLVFSPLKNRLSSVI